MSSDNALRLLRAKVMDESESLSALLRATLMLGAETGSDELRSWAARELNGYDDDDELPEYRLITAPLYIDSISGNFHAKAQQISAYAVPEEARDFVSGPLQMRQPIAEIEDTAKGDREHIGMGLAGFADLAALWTSRLGPFQQIVSIYYQVARSSFAGIVDRVRTTLVQLVSELVADVPEDELPSRTAVDNAVHVHVQGRKHKVNVVQDSPKSVAGEHSNVGTAASAGTGAEPEDADWWTWPKKVAVMVGGIGALLTAIAAAADAWPF